MKKIVCRLLDVRYWLAVLLLVLVFNIDTVYANERSGQCGEDVYWTLSEDGVMTISGEGKMWDFRNDLDDFDYHECPWTNFKEDIKNVVFKSGVTYVGADAFNECRRITKITFTDTITTISPGAFMYCVDLESVSLPEKLESLGQESFAYCEKIENVKIPDTVTFLDAAFQNCTSLKEVYIGGKQVSSLTTYRGAMFRGCTALEDIKVSEGNIALKSVDGLLYEKESDVLLQYPIGRKDKKFVLPETTTAIADFALQGAIALEEVILPEGLKMIGVGVFYDCKYLKSLTIPSTVEVVSSDIFLCCYRLEYVENKSDVSIVMLNGGTIWIDENGNVIEELKNGKAYQHGLATSVVVDDQILCVGESVVIPSQINYMYIDYPQNAEDLIFESSNADVVTVDEEGNLLAKKGGKATITIRNRYVYETPYINNAFEAICNVTVKELNKISIEGAKVTLSPTGFEYDGTAKQPTVVVELGNKTLSLGKDYTLNFR